MLLNWLLIWGFFVSVVGNVVVYYAEILPTLDRQGFRDLASRAQNGFYYFTAIKLYVQVCKNTSRGKFGLFLLFGFQVCALAIGLYLFRG